MRPTSLAVIGLGAIGGSVAWQSRLAGVRRVVGYSPELSEGVQALKASAITELADSPARAVQGADLVVLAVPPRPTLDLLVQLAPMLEPAAVITDVCSVKAPVMRQAVAAGLAGRFAGSHPLAGTHGSGFSAARPDRLRGCVVYVCDSGGAMAQKAAQYVASFWRHTLESLPVHIDAGDHDRQLAWTSHLPQAVAYALARSLAGRGLGAVSYGTGAKDTMRLAESSPDIWTDIFLYNRTEVSEALERTEAALAELRKVIAQDDMPALRQYLESARAFRQGIER